MVNNQVEIDLGEDEIAVDLFAGAGGFGHGFYAATGRHMDIAINHWGAALEMYRANSPGTEIRASDVFAGEVDPKLVTKGRKVGYLHLSPDCRHHSTAKGKAIRSPKIRASASIAIVWARQKRPRIITAENVPKFLDWGPLNRDGTPCERRKGKSFRHWRYRLERMGYKVEWRVLDASDYGAPTCRKRLFIIARCDGKPIYWPSVTHRCKEKRTIAQCIDWSLEGPSIFERKTPLKEATLKRIFKGLKRFVIDNQSSSIFETSNCAVVPFIAKNYTGVTGHGVDRPLGTITTVDHHSLIFTYITKLYKTCIGSSISEPLHTITASGAHHGLVKGFLVKYYGTGGTQTVNEPVHTITTRDRFGLVTIKDEPVILTISGEQYAIRDIGFRMLTVDELYRAQGFPSDWVKDVIDPDTCKPVNRTDLKKAVGNSVPPQLAEAVVRANLVKGATPSKNLMSNDFQYQPELLVDTRFA